ncbi:succinate dehydrogenase cytochrome b subunit [Mucilaginibacter limnophilus]|uniref:Succinate dehydrogenase cytochrome b subunit n=1 Tax=Mucilaginibacter limnophilus TaxID=1932778 RepID=A0A437MQP0_9SPHI|nr:succinate dehydrogenase cytochrome b subunit [Mucilaginibacter limnophilus]RVT99970.1 succinate dehydrogenase cytochrome b subunit [Mucilaginibacter limnophilus]
MSEFKQTFNSSLGKKLIMALTGLFLCTFLIVHLSGNLALFKHDNGQAFNAYANFMTHFPPIRVISYILYLTILLHTIYAIVLTIRNRRARPISYVSGNDSPQAWSAKNMGILGSILFLFIVIHMKDFWFKYHKDDWSAKGAYTIPFKEYKTNLVTGEQISARDLPPGDYEYAVYNEGSVETMIAKDLNQTVEVAFKQWWYVLFYVIAMVTLSLHLLHGFQSAFHTMGWIHRKYKPIIYFIGTWLFAVIIPVGFAAMPVVYYFFR